MAEDRKSFVIKESENGGVNITDEVVCNHRRTCCYRGGRCIFSGWKSDQ